MGIRLKTKKLIYAGTAGFMLATTIGSGGFYYWHNKEQERELELINKYEKQLEVLENTAAQNFTAYALKADIDKGTTITPEMLTPASVSKAAAAADTIRISDLKRDEKFVYQAKTNMKKATVLVQSMVYDTENITNDTREAEYSFIELPSNISTDSYVDIRIKFPTGDDYVVLTKKHLKKLSGVTTWFNIGESELLTISSAIVDAYLNGAKIYAIPYVDEHMQEKSTMTYPIKPNVQELIRESPNVVNLYEMELEKLNRGRLENNLRDLSEEQKAKIQDGDQQVQSKVSEENAKSTEEERLNAINNQAQHQQALIGGDSE
ncbi:hypothetical protein ACOMCU_16010 [Lysinibacillus sp. UGB7]|uniref:hypothetical protein n=1 Tax=Lysinibacillus sp. UGB7 TaxID=3411039 RepID=UPI003B7D1923